jgi:hypothetical protein
MNVRSYNYSSRFVCVGPLFPSVTCRDKWNFLGFPSDFGGSPCFYSSRCPALSESYVHVRLFCGASCKIEVELALRPSRPPAEPATKIRARRPAGRCVRLRPHPGSHNSQHLTWFCHGVALCRRSRAARSASQLELAGRTLADRSVSNHDGLRCESVSEGNCLRTQTTPRFVD